MQVLINVNVWTKEWPMRCFPTTQRCSLSYKIHLHFHGNSQRRIFLALINFQISDAFDPLAFVLSFPSHFSFFDDPSRFPWNSNNHIYTDVYLNITFWRVCVCAVVYFWYVYYCPVSVFQWNATHKQTHKLKSSSVLGIVWFGCNSDIEKY